MNDEMKEDKTAPSAAPVDALPRDGLIAGRFRVEALAGRGGMGLVYRARDTVSGQLVALKLLNSTSTPEGLQRFNREAALLQRLRHPNIVSYVAHGTSGQDQPFLAMEWLEGEELSRRLARQPLRLPETLALMRRVAEALAHAHHQGVIHRDLKPSNLFLRAGEPGDVVVLDFGLARHTLPSLQGLTGSHTVLGTPGYMAPEQASSQAEILPAADIFSLGCVLYECLTGTPPFAAPHFAAALAKILFAEPRPLDALRPGLPPELQGLVNRMLAKDPQQRLADADALLAALSSLGAVPEPPPPPRSGEAPPTLSMAAGEQKLVSVLLLSPRAGGLEPGTDEGLGPPLRDALRGLLAPYGGRVELLANGSVVATLVPEQGAATDQAALAARCALTCNERWPDVTVVLVMGLGMLDAQRPVGEAMERAGHLLRRVEELSASSQVVLDEVTAGLLGPGFQLSRVDSGRYLLHGEQLSADESRPLLGKPTPCVGREQELALLDFSFNTCCEEPAARAVLVTAPAGGGKSRLRHEFLRRIERRSQLPLVLLGRGNPMEAGAASSGLLGQALRRLCGIEGGANLETRRTRLYQRVAQHLSGAEAQEVVAFLGELCAIPFPDEFTPRLRAARGDPGLLSRHMGQALVSFLQAECEHQPVLWVLEDLHWSDALTIQLLDEALKALDEQPMMVLALARPEVKERFGSLWARHLQEVPLHGLSRKAGARLVREVLGPQVPEAIVRRAVEQADGNALFLEELIRRIAEGRGESVPETILAVLQSRLTRMEPAVRQVLLAASLFGRDFWVAGVRELLGGRTADGLLEKCLRWLEEQEIIGRQPTSRFPATEEYRFRHALLREAAHGLAPGGYRSTGHAGVAAWLERMGETDALVLATHYHLGEQPEPAARWYTQAAEWLFERNDFQGMARCVEGALACGVSGERLSRLRAFQAVAAFWMEQLPKIRELGDPVLSGLRAGSALWCRLTGMLIIANAEEGRTERTAQLSEQLLSTPPEPGASGDYIESVLMLLTAALRVGDRPRVDGLLARILDVGATVPEDVRARAWMRAAQCFHLYYLEAAPWRAFQMGELSSSDFRAFNPEGHISPTQAFAGLTLAALGDVPGALLRLREIRESARDAAQPRMVMFAGQCLLQILADSAEPEHGQEARALALESLESLPPGSQWGAMAHITLAKTELAQGAPREAEARARTACASLKAFHNDWLQAQAVLSRVLLRQGHAPEARREAETGVAELERARSQGVFAVGLYLALAEACLALGDAEAAQRALGEGLRCVRARADDIPDALQRERFLTQVPENARTLRLARERWGEAAG